MRNNNYSAIVDQQTYTYDDIERYTYAHYNGRAGWIMDKGDHLSDARGRHIYIEFEDSTKGSDTAVLHENLVNKYLREGRDLWVDINRKLRTDNPQNATA